ncbi:hypothetical protein ACSSS7_002403 [Eimeria intestinalis]
MMTANPVAGSPRIPFDKPGCVVGLCVRSLLDLFIQAVRSLHPALLPEGSVVLVAAVNIPMMFRILEEHKLLVQPVDVHPSSLMPTNESLQQAMTCWGPRIKGLLCSHLYGGISDMEPVVKFCTKYKILLLEDCAESFVGELYRVLVPFQQPSDFSEKALRHSGGMLFAKSIRYEEPSDTMQEEARDLGFF